MKKWKNLKIALLSFKIEKRLANKIQEIQGQIV